MTAARLLTPGQVAQLLGLPSSRSFLRRLPKLREGRFPAPIEGLGQRWDRRAVDAWLDLQSAIGPASFVQNNGAGEAELIRRAGLLREVSAHDA